MQKTTLYEKIACVSNISSFPQNPMPITITNPLPYINFHLELILEVDDYMCMLVDSSAAMNIGNKDYYWWLMS